MNASVINIGVLVLFAAVLWFAFQRSVKVMEQTGDGKDGLMTRAVFPDKAVHFLCGFALYFALVSALSLDPLYACALVVAGAIAFEMIQGRTVRVFDAPGHTKQAWHLLDIAAGVAGGALAYLFHIT